MVFAAVQSDMKRLLAYSSIENIGIILVGIGLTLIFQSYGMRALAALALTATLYHCLNHAFFKSLLFLGTGSVLHATRERSLGKLGGLIHRMPWVAWLALVGTLAIAGLPPLNGFVSEWLLLQAFLLTPGLPHPYLNMLVPVAAAAVALAAALAGYVMVKFYGVIFLGQPREERLAEAHDAGLRERTGLIWLAAGCVALGLAPVAVIGVIDSVTGQLLGARPWATSADRLDVPRADRPGARELRAAAVPAGDPGGMAADLARWCAASTTAACAARRPGTAASRRRPRACRTRAEGFGQPIRQIFEPFFRMQRELPSPFDAAAALPRHGRGPPLVLALPAAGERSPNAVTRVVGAAAARPHPVYLMYSFVTLLAAAGVRQMIS